MHHTHRVLQIACCSVLLIAVATATAQELRSSVTQPSSPAGRGAALVIPINGTQRLQMRTKKRIQNVLNPKESVARVQPIPNDPTSVLVTGLDAGLTQITMIDENGVQETLDIVVQFDIEYLRTLLQRAVPSANVVPIPGANNTIILTGTVSHAEDVDVISRMAVSVVGGPDRLINAMRVGGVQQVQLDVVVARVERRLLRRMAFDFINFGQQHVFASTVGGAFNIPSNGISGTFPGAPIITNAVGNPNGVPSNLFLGIFSPEQDFFGLLQALKDENLAKIMAEPRLVSLSGRNASFLDGGEQAVPVPAGLGQIGVQFEEFGTRLNFLPIVLGNGRIHLEVEPEVSGLDPTAGTTINGTVVPGRKTQRIHTTVEMEDGQTYALGGLIQSTVNGTTSKVPIVGELPLLGAAFSRKSFEEVEFELIVLVTPHLVDAMSCDQLPKFLPGQETRSPDDFELFLEGILEAPRGPRCVCPNGRYVPAYRNGPTATLFPCAGGRCGDQGSGVGCSSPAGCNNGGACPESPSGLRPSSQDAAVRPTATPPAKPSTETITQSDEVPGNDGKPTNLPPSTTAPESTEGQQR
jgi:pilus assembly protein CpaC